MGCLCATLAKSPESRLSSRERRSQEAWLARVTTALQLDGRFFASEHGASVVSFAEIRAGLWLHLPIDGLVQLVASYLPLHIYIRHEAVPITPGPQPIH